MILHYEPRPYQRIGTGFVLDHQRCNLWAKPGMGKTSIVEAAVDIMDLSGSSFFPVLVIAPKRVAEIVWSGEIAKWDAFQRLRLIKVLGTAQERAAALRQPVAHIYTINYENIPWLMQQLGSNWPFKTVVADESTRLAGFRIRNSTIRADALADVAKLVGRWINLSGTPAANGYKKLWGPQWFVDFGSRLGRSYSKFEQAYLQTSPYTRAVTLNPGADVKIQEALADCTLALRPEDWFDIEKPLFRKVEAILPPEARTLYAEMERKFFVELGGGIEAVNSGVKSMKLLQLASGSIFENPEDADRVAHAIHDAKVEALESIVNELDEPLLVAYWWTFSVDRIKKVFPKATTLRTERDIKDWNAGKIDVLLVHYLSAGHGISLQDGGRAIAYYDQIYDTELRLQVLERLGPTRQIQSGYKRTVLVYDIVSQNTVDEAALEKNELGISVEDALMRARARRG